MAATLLGFVHSSPHSILPRIAVVVPKAARIADTPCSDLEVDYTCLHHHHLRLRMGPGLEEAVAHWPVAGVRPCQCAGVGDPDHGYGVDDSGSYIHVRESGN